MRYAQPPLRLRLWRQRQQLKCFHPILLPLPLQLLLLLTPHQLPWPPVTQVTLCCFKRRQLLHEPCVGGHPGSNGFQMFERSCQGEVVAGHEVSQHYCCAAGDASCTMHQHIACSNAGSSAEQHRALQSEKSRAATAKVLRKLGGCWQHMAVMRHVQEQCRQCRKCGTLTPFLAFLHQLYWPNDLCALSHTT